MDKILKNDFAFKPTTHEGCLYTGACNNVQVLFFRQVGDFSVASRKEQIAIDLIANINTQKITYIKDLGQLARYNGADSVQAKYFIQLSNEHILINCLESMISC